MRMRAWLRLVIAAAVPRFVAGPEGGQWLWLLGACAVSAVHTAASLFSTWTVSLTAHSIATRMACSWNSGTPNVRSSAFSSDGWS